MVDDEKKKEIVILIKVQILYIYHLVVACGYYCCLLL